MILMEMIRIGFTTLIRILLADIINTTGMDFVSMIYVAVRCVRLLFS